MFYFKCFVLNLKKFLHIIYVVLVSGNHVSLAICIFLSEMFSLYITGCPADDA